MSPGAAGDDADQTVRRYASAATLRAAASPRRPRHSRLDPLKDYLHRCWQEGCHNATRLHNGGGSVADLQRLLGHESPQMSRSYAHITNADAVERQKSNSVVDRQWRRDK